MMTAAAELQRKRQVEKADVITHELLDRVLMPGYYGQVVITYTIQDGSIQAIGEKLERQRMPSAVQPPAERQ